MLAQRLAPLLAAPLLLATTSCIVDPDPPERVYHPAPAPPPAPPPPPTTSTVNIATGQTLNAEGGQGAGVLVEYLGEGQWYVWTVCDTFVTGLVCSYDITLALEPNASFVSVVDEPADADGSNVAGAGATQTSLLFGTRTEVDGVLVRVGPPGAPLFVRATLDGKLDPDVVFWVDEAGAVRHGSPTNPLWFAPTVP
ncbi:MAG TPA: hypothetical protein VFS43_15205 [Polyangiaceae bacterium]|nr:hypothetical protein [Polyangiaceae bacterium]